MRFTRLSFLRSRWTLALLLVLAVGGVWALASKPHAKAVVAVSYDTTDARNTLRKTSLTSLANALNAYVAANPGKKLPVAIPVTDTEICTVSGVNCKNAKLIDLTFLANPGNYIASIPTDPTGAHDRYGTGLTIGRDQISGKFRFTAPRTEDTAVIVVEK